eukprot:15103013-Alexandrium_andersonii.AAC.1
MACARAVRRCPCGCVCACLDRQWCGLVGYAWLGVCAGVCPYGAVLAATPTPVEWCWPSLALLALALVGCGDAYGLGPFTGFRPGFELGLSLIHI